MNIFWARLLDALRVIVDVVLFFIFEVVSCVSYVMFMNTLSNMIMLRKYPYYRVSHFVLFDVLLNYDMDLD